jgi:predicted  nucleic acid-binding Zn-ribbon protein
MSNDPEMRAQLNESEMHRHELMERLQDRVAEIAALQSEVAILKESNKGYQRTAQTILEVKSERDALREGLRAELLRLGHAARNSDPSIAALYNRWIERLELLLSVPASGEPARKP